METINDRMELIANELFGGNKANFAKSIGLLSTGLSNYLGNKRRSKPSVDMVTKIVTNLGVNPYWLLTGEGDMLSSRSAATMSVSGHHNQVNGSGAQGNINADGSVDSAVLRERVEALQKLLAEKERTIKILLRQNTSE